MQPVYEGSNSDKDSIEVYWHELTTELETGGVAI